MEKFYNKEGQIQDENTARELAEVEKPFREKKILGIFPASEKQIEIGENAALEYEETKVKEHKKEEKVEKEKKHEKEVNDKEKREKMDTLIELLQMTDRFRKYASNEIESGIIDVKFSRYFGVALIKINEKDKKDIENAKNFLVVVNVEDKYYGFPQKYSEVRVNEIDITDLKGKIKILSIKDGYNNTTADIRYGIDSIKNNGLSEISQSVSFADDRFSLV